MGYFVGVDQALLKIGFCVIQDDGEAEKFELIKPTPKVRGTKRLLLLRDLLETALLPYAGQVIHAALEGQSLGSLGDIDQLGQINGVVQIVLADIGVADPSIVPPATLKKFVTGKGHASKALMRTATEQHWGLDIEQDDLCDAFGLAQVAREVHQQQSILRHQIEAVHSLHAKKRRRAPVRRVLPESL
ncbi:MAG: hypothetical protein CMK74_00780 [Pseudomonadales bacterium]|nr:hypothetical protein [Pseudomonadales bacterium]